MGGAGEVRLPHGVGVTFDADLTTGVVSSIELWCALEVHRSRVLPDLLTFIHSTLREDPDTLRLPLR